MARERTRLLMDWHGLESRLKEILRDTERSLSDHACAYAVFRMDAAIAAFTGRGNSISKGLIQGYAGMSKEEADNLERAEWDHAEAIQRSAAVRNAKE